MADGLQIGKRLQIKVAYSEADWYSSRIEDLTGTEITIGAPIKGGELVPISPGTLLDCQFPQDDAFYAFQAEVLQRRTKPLPVLILRRPESVQRFQRRRLFRLPVVLPVTFTVAGAEDNPYKGQTLDLSGCGLSFVLSDPLELGVDLQLNVALPDGHVVVATGRVVKAQQVEIPGGARYVYGVEFRDLPVTTQEQIVAYIFAEQRERRRREVGRW